MPSPNRIPILIRMGETLHRRRIATWLALTVGVLAVSLGLPHISQGAVVTSQTDPWFIGPGNGYSISNQVAVQPDNPGSTLGKLGYRVEGSSNWNRCKYPGSFRVPDEALALPEGEHFVEFADDEDPLNHSFGEWPSFEAWSAAAALCGSLGTSPLAPPGAVLKVPFVVDKSPPEVQVTHKVWQGGGRVCFNMSDELTGLDSATLSWPAGLSMGSQMFELQGASSKRFCANFVMDSNLSVAHAFYLVRDLAGQSVDKTVDFKLARKPNQVSRPFRARVIRTTVYPRSRQVIILFNFNRHPVRSKCGLAGRPLHRCHSPVRIRNLPLGRSTVVIRIASLKSSEVRTLRVPVTIRQTR